MKSRGRQDAILRTLRRTGTSTLAALVREVGASRSTILRDLSALRDEGYVIHAEQGRGGGLRLDPGSVPATARRSTVPARRSTGTGMRGPSPPARRRPGRRCRHCWPTSAPTSPTPPPGASDAALTAGPGRAARRGCAERACFAREVVGRRPAGFRAGSWNMVAAYTTKGIV